MRQLTSWIGEQTKFDPEKILLWKMSAYNEKPTSYLTEHQHTTFKVRGREQSSLSSFHS